MSNHTRGDSMSLSKSIDFLNENLLPTQVPAKGNIVGAILYLGLPILL